ncbi:MULTISPECIES: sulfurtransferase TusA family protein [unclassified Psychrobacter]|uniref:sulfurtransferase TusA family protein n=1 Tax=unclassified Psychrobacter TaxID=196806 RepID=UPI0025B4CF8E|nr:MULTISPECIES: sulfurtransferase TusA family protein [unclassified Psychrobacter]MDN3454184.1 sulfurtransferase TusA family protein [Psychrobacter sp. APC 3350]MDN3501431.1 sulfurtransferase TusA family protein [Psychrobacter sp. 5A.1]
MSADSKPVIERASHVIRLSANLTDVQQQDINNLLELLPTESHNSDDVATAQPELNIKSFVDGRGLACPMPLLKTKVALRDVTVGESLYVVATDPNSQADITAFCRQSQQSQATDYLDLVVNEVTDHSSVDGTSLQRFATIYHFIITKTDSN